MDDPVLWTTCESPLGLLTLLGRRTGIVALHFPGGARRLPAEGHRPAAFADATEQLAQYFAGERRRFELDLDVAGTAFQRGVWRELVRIRFGTTVSYGALAARMGRPQSVRAVAAAIGRTPIPILLPCHRVVAADGALTGYRGGLRCKAALLELERSVAAGRDVHGRGAVAGRRPIARSRGDADTRDARASSRGNC